MSNPGSFKARSTEWLDFSNGKPGSDTFIIEDYPDPTMQNVIEVIRAAYTRNRLGSPDGVVSIYNLSNIVESKGEKAEERHENAMKIIREKNLQISILEDPTVFNIEKLIHCCDQANFMIVGFLKYAFLDKVAHVQQYMENPSISNKLVVAVDKDNFYAHPVRWRREKHLMDAAISELSEVLSKRG
ncbi:hypothetical protein [Brevibacillus nitrificans]|uniref:hypothetical protein n=1 Tax=Brevibacillus nitrificans TaxID=651560 RepID=UPI00285E1E04|nr:hypothetical protein [Brevibacillus nitrificans]MDR7316048.1 hypothetical protein [Brevibacillus nitrificans]